MFLFGVNLDVHPLWLVIVALIVYASFGKDMLESLSAKASSFGSPPPSARSDLLNEEMRMTRERQQQRVAAAAAAAGQRPKPKRKPAHADAVSSSSRVTREKKKTPANEFSHLLGQQSQNYRPARRTRRGG